MSAPAIDTNLLERAVGRLPEDGLAALRRDAAERFADTGFPSTRHEDWKYTSLAPAIELSNKWLRRISGQAVPTGSTKALTDKASELTGAIHAHWIVIANGKRVEEPLSALAKVAGLSVHTSASADTPIATGDPLSRFNAALLQDVIRIDVAAGVNIERPLGLLVIDDADEGATVSQARFVVNVGENARAQFVELHASTGSLQHFANTVTELRLHRGARADFLRLQQRAPQHMHTSRLIVTLARDSSLEHAAFDLGGSLVRNDVSADISEPGASVRLDGLYLADDSQHIDNHTRIDHRVGPATSVEEYRGILNGRARCVFNGKAIVHAGADGTDAQQANHNLLLSEKAEIDTKPELEIYADDVKCSHGATVGQLDENALFYLRSRGLDRQQAAQALTRAFAAAVVSRSPVRGAQQHLEALIEERLMQLTGGIDE